MLVALGGAVLEGSTFVMRQHLRKEGSAHFPARAPGVISEGKKQNKSSLIIRMGYYICSKKKCREGSALISLHSPLACCDDKEVTARLLRLSPDYFLVYGALLERIFSSLIKYFCLGVSIGW